MKYKLKMENKALRLLGTKELAYIACSAEDLPVGSRVVVLKKVEEISPEGSPYLSGIVAEPPIKRNRQRYVQILGF